jgi:glutamate/tyrosine decarboxylase-like PLP-dependent enzyme
MANLVGLAVARNTRAGFDIRRQGLMAAPRPLTLYGSVEMHSSLQKAVELLGLGSEALRQIPVDGECRIDLAALESAISADREAGLQPICVIGNAGTVNTGAIDNLQALADCVGEDCGFMWMGRSARRLASSACPLVQGLNGPICWLDLHKWLYLPFDAGCILRAVSRITTWRSPSPRISGSQHQ